MYLFLKRNSIFKHNYMGAFDVSCVMFSNVNVFVLYCATNPSLILRDSDTDPENVSLIWLSVSDGQKTCSSKGVSLIS